MGAKEPPGFARTAAQDDRVLDATEELPSDEARGSGYERSHAIFPSDFDTGCKRGPLFRVHAPHLPAGIALGTAGSGIAPAARTGGAAVRLCVEIVPTLDETRRIWG